MRWVLVVVSVLVAVVLVAAAGPPVKNHDLEVELIRMEKAVSPFESSRGPVGFGGLQRTTNNIEAALAANAVRIKEIVATYGWPTKSMVGDEASHDAWLIVERNQDKDLLQTALDAMRKHKDDIINEDFAFAVDRVALANGQPQTYGTMLFCRGDGPEPAVRVKDPVHLDARRHSVGLPPLKGYTGDFQRVACPPVTIEPNTSIPSSQDTP